MSHENYFEDLEAQFEAELENQHAQGHRQVGQLGGERQVILGVQTHQGQIIRLGAPILGLDFCAGIDAETQSFNVLALAAVFAIRAEFVASGSTALTKVVDELGEFLDRFTTIGTRVSVAFLDSERAPTIGWLGGRIFGLLELHSDSAGSILLPIASIARLQIEAVNNSSEH